MTSEITSASPEDIEHRAAIDRSVKFPVLFFFTSGAAWLFVATFLGFFSALKLRVPELWDGCAILTYGRLFPAHTNALIYGWGMQAGFGIIIWLMARLCRVTLKNPITLIVAGHVWNFGVSIGILAILFGYGSSVIWLEFPRWIWPMLLLAYVFITIWMVVMFRARREGTLYISQLYLLGAIFWFPWIYMTANILIHHRNGSAVMEAGVDAWYTSNLVFFWFAPVALASAYYIIPKIVGRPIHSYSLANLGFWSLAIFAGWTGIQRYIGGPLPAWMPAVSGAATIFILLSVMAVGVNQYRTLKGKMSLAAYSPSLRFTVVGCFMFTLYGLFTAASSYFGIGRYLQFSDFVPGLDTLALYGFFTMTAFGAVYFIVPRITGCEWPSGALIRFHFWFSTYGIITIVMFMLISGYFQGRQLDNWNVSFMVAVSTSKNYLVARIIGWVFISVANFGFFYQLALMFAGKGRKSEGPTLIHARPGSAPSAEAAAAKLEKGGVHA